jgi:hypothetical protein
MPSIEGVLETELEKHPLLDLFLTMDYAGVIIQFSPRLPKTKEQIREEFRKELVRADRDLGRLI